MTAALEALEAAGRVVQGEFRPGRHRPGVVRRGGAALLRQRSLARLRHEVEPVEQAALGRLYLAWQGIGARRRGPDALVEVAGAAPGGGRFPARSWRRGSSRLALSLRTRELDALTASGSVLWVGCEGLGERDGRVSLYLAEHAALLLAPPADRPEGPSIRDPRAPGEPGRVLLPPAPSRRAAAVFSRR